MTAASAACPTCGAYEQLGAAPYAERVRSTLSSTATRVATPTEIA